MIIKTLVLNSPPYSLTALPLNKISVFSYPLQLQGKKKLLPVFYIGLCVCVCARVRASINKQTNILVTELLPSPSLPQEHLVPISLQQNSEPE